MKISLRPHHLLCLKGYKGLNYSSIQVKHWSTISEKLKNSPDADILIVRGKDDLCQNCPATAKDTTFCKEFIVKILDRNIQSILGITAGEIYKYTELLKKLEQNMNYEKHEKLCQTCSWWKKGLCHDSFQKKPADK